MVFSRRCIGRIQSTRFRNVARDKSLGVSMRERRRKGCFVGILRQKISKDGAALAESLTRTRNELATTTFELNVHVIFESTWDRFTA